MSLVGFKLKKDCFGKNGKTQNLTVAEGGF